jgi:hypothetical protein
MAAHDEEALRLFEDEGLSYEQIRERLGLRTTKQVNHAIDRARKARQDPPPSTDLTAAICNEGLGLDLPAETIMSFAAVVIGWILVEGYVDAKH